MIDGLPEGMLDEKTPPEIRFTDEPRKPDQDPISGIDVEVTAEGLPRHQQEAIEDSLARVLQSSAIYTDHLYPAINTHEMG